MKPKLLAYRFGLTRTGAQLIRGASSILLSIPFLKRHGESKFPFYVCVTVDTEAGYVAKDQERIWQHRAPKAYQGFTAGIDHWLQLAEKNKVPLTFLLSTHCFSAPPESLSKINKLLKKVVKDHELGLHMHQNSDNALQDKLKKPLSKAGARYYSTDDQIEMLSASKQLIADNLGPDAAKEVKSFRWGVWSLSTESVSALEKTGFNLDSSAVPGIKGHTSDDMAYDWTKVKTHDPWYMSRTDYQDTKSQDSSILQIPVATFDFLGMKHANPAWGELLIPVFDQYMRQANRSKKPFVFVVLSHSCEANYENGWPTPIVETMDAFIKHAKQNGAQFLTLQEAGKKWI